MHRPKESPLSIDLASIELGLSNVEVRRLIASGLLAGYQPPRGDLLVERKSIIGFKRFFRTVSAAAKQCGISIEEVQGFISCRTLNTFVRDSGSVLVDTRRLQLLLSRLRPIKKRAEKKTKQLLKRQSLQPEFSTKADSYRLCSSIKGPLPKRKPKRKRKHKKQIQKRRSSVFVVGSGQTRKAGSHRGSW